MPGKKFTYCFKKGFIVVGVFSVVAIYRVKYMKKEIIYKDDTVIVYKCGCKESRLEVPEYFVIECKNHKKI